MARTISDLNRDYDAASDKYRKAAKDVNEEMEKMRNEGVCRGNSRYEELLKLSEGLERFYLGKLDQEYNRLAENWLS